MWGLQFFPHYAERLASWGAYWGSSNIRLWGPPFFPHYTERGKFLNKFCSRNNFSSCPRDWHHGGPIADLLKSLLHKALGPHYYGRRKYRVGPSISPPLCREMRVSEQVSSRNAPRAMRLRCSAVFCPGICGRCDFRRRWKLLRLCVWAWWVNYRSSEPLGTIILWC